MLHGGASLQAFKAWAGGPLNLVILPGYQVGGTLGSRLVNGVAGKPVQVDSGTQLEVRCQVRPRRRRWGQNESKMLSTFPGLTITLTFSRFVRESNR